MIVWFPLVAVAAELVEVRIPFPAEPIFEGEQRVCLNASVSFVMPSTEVEDSGFRISCSMAPARPKIDTGNYRSRMPDKHIVRACVTLLEGTSWPERVPEYSCMSEGSQLVVKPIIGFDPNDDIADGVEILSSVNTLGGAFRVPTLPDAPGLLPGGTCGVGRGILWIEIFADNPKERTCTLIFEDHEMKVPIRLVTGLAKPETSG